ncbi:FecR family protein [Sphingomonas sp. Ant H11]|uniref:FecR family protein n=2 Tax=Bacteria TaxID=2 RepID=UPI00068BD70B|nr:FecR domain-containing protein [Sphingomonas sp. Ant H11]
MSRRATLQEAAGLALSGETGQGPQAATAECVRATLDDPALEEALGAAAAFGRLSDADILAMRERRQRTLATGGDRRFADRGWRRRLASDAHRHRPCLATHYETKRGEERSIALADGSRLELNGATALDVTIDAQQRTVVLRRGEAFFDVAHEPDRPFVVTARGSSTRVLGTAFDIDLARNEVKLAVFRGRVRFGASDADTGVLVPAGWRSRFDGTTASAPSRFDPTQQDWRHNWLDTDEMRLGDLVEALNRHGGPVILPPPPRLEKLVLSGRFKLDNPEQLLGAIGAAYGFTVVRQGAHLRLMPTGPSDTKMSSQ